MTQRASAPVTRAVRADFDAAVSVALERIADATANVLAGQNALWKLAKNDPILADLAVQLSGVLGALEARRYALEESVGL